MTKLFLIRHGQSEWNQKSIVQGQKDTKLSHLGKKQAEKLGIRFSNEKIDYIYSSDLSRAFNTAKIIADKINMTVIVDKSIREINFGSWEGLTIEEIKSKYKEDYILWKQNPDKLQVQGGESLEVLQKRSLDFIHELLNKHKGKNIAIVSHTATLKVLILGLLGIPLSNYKNLALNNVSLTTIEVRDYNVVLTSLNDVSHLKEL